VPDAVAAVDCGTNSTRLLVADPDGVTLERRMTITRLGAGVDRTRTLAPDAVERTVTVLRSYREVMDRHGVGPRRVTATSAARDATNRDAFLAAAAAATGATVEVLGGDEEGRLSFAGATAGLDAATGPWLVADIGGGSTELAAGPVGGSGPDRLAPEAVCSLDVGCVRITERFLLHDPPRPAELAAARGHVGAELDRAVADRPALRRPHRLVGLAGTVAATASLDQRLDGYDRGALHHHRLGAATVSGLLDELAGLDVDARRRRPGMEDARAGVIVGGLVVLDTLMRRFGFDVCLTSEADILDGLVMTMLGERTTGGPSGPTGG
jgi:exopolyphosphatase/guanosine-5'-triphosphate,3'-diphosphate pyrophosphatase